MKHVRIALLCAAATLLSVGPSRAGPTLTVTGVSVVGDAVTVTAPIGPAQTIAGPITLESTFGRLVAWCVDLYHDVYTGAGQSLHYRIGTVTTDGAPSAQTLSAAQTRTIGQLAEYGQSLIGTSQGTNDALAAVQLAIWRTEYAGFAYTGAEGASIAQALAMAATFPATDAGLIALDGTQTFVTADPRAIAALPEPAAWALLGLAGTALLLARRRRAG